MKNYLPALILASATLVFGADPAISEKDLIYPVDLAHNLKTALVIHVGFPVLYRASHIAGSQFAGPASKAQGIEELKKAVAGQPLDREIVLYCGCCGDRCPNTRPAAAALRALGFTHVKTLALGENLQADWADKGFPTEKHAGN